MPDTRTGALVLTDQPIVAALIGYLQLEVIGREPVFANAGEARTRRCAEPVLHSMVVLIDAALPAAQSDLLFALAARG